MEEIAKLNPLYTGGHLSELAPYLANNDTLKKAIKTGYMAAPGIMHPSYRQEHLLTKPTKYGFIDAIDFETYKVLSEEERLN